MEESEAPRAAAEPVGSGDHATTDRAADPADGPRERWLRRRRDSEGDPGARRSWSHQLARQLAEARMRREHAVNPALSPVGPGPATRSVTPHTNLSPGHVPHGVDLAAAWSWRLLVIVAGGWVLIQAVQLLAVLLMPLVVALFISALATPAVHLLTRVMPRGIASLIVVVGVLGVVVLMLTFATNQVVDGFSDLSEQVVAALASIQEWLREGPLQVSEQQINRVLQDMQDLVASSSELFARLTEVGTTVGHVVAGFFIVLFATYFFLADGERIWAWVVRIFPGVARERADSSGRVAWLSLTQFVRATVLVAAVDAIGIMVVAAVLQVPLVGAIGVLVFLGAFVPVIGATLSGLIAVLVALVAQGPFAALLMLLGVVGVQQLESHLLQPFLMGRMVKIHPLGVILAVATGVLIAGIAGALVAVPVVASVNAVVVHLVGQGRLEAQSAMATEEEEAPVTDSEPPSEGPQS